MGHKRQANVESNLAVSTHEPLTPTQLKAAHRAIAESRLRAKRAETVSVYPFAVHSPPCAHMFTSERYNLYNRTAFTKSASLLLALQAV